MTVTESKSRLPTLIAIAMLIAAAGIWAAGPISGRDEPRWIRLAVEWTPATRSDPIAITWTINGVPGPDIPPVYQSPWPPRDIALHRGEVLALHARQRNGGQLICRLFERGEPLFDDTTNDVGGIVECVAIG